jgi:flagellar protein FliS
MSLAAYAYAPARTPSVSLSAAASPRPAAAPIARAAVRPAGGSGGYAAQASRYRDAELAAATPGQLVVMLFDKCLLTVRRAEAAFAAGDVPARVEHVCRAADMVTELRASLDFEAGGAISTQLDALYAFVLGELFAANRDRDPARLTPALRVLGGLRDGFAGAQAQLAVGTAGAAAVEGSAA